MAKWIYERWSLKWDISNPVSIETEMPSSAHVIDISTAQADTELTSPTDPVMALAPTNAELLEAFNEWLISDWVYYGYAGQQGGILVFRVSGAELAQRRIKDGHLEDVILEEGTVPDDGIHTDGYWYIKARPVEPVDATYRYDANGGRFRRGVVTEFDTVTGTEILLATRSEVGLSNTGHNFEGWQVRGTRRILQEGAAYTIQGDTVFDAVWSVVGSDPVVDPMMRIFRDGQWIEVESGYVLKDGVWKPIEDIFVLKDGQWKNIQ